MRLVIRRFKPGDAGEFHAYRSDPAVALYQGWEPLDEAGAQSFVFEHSRLEAVPDGDWRQLAIAQRDSALLLGDIGLMLDADSGQVARFGITLSPRQQGQGYGSEALRLLFDGLFRAGVQRIEAECDPRNEPSWRLIEAVGMRREGHLRRNLWHKGEWADTYWYGLLVEDWPAK